MNRARISVAGLVGLVAVAYAAVYYAGADAIAFVLVLLIAAGLIIGIVELLRYEARLRGLREELSRVIAAGDRDAVDGASPTLRSLLRARLDRVPLGVPAPTLAPFLVGMLVMLGLLGTFAGLFETLRGASGALSSGADVEALRVGLATPIAGLMRSFGTSASGVTASACLGLGLVFARQEGAAFAAALHTAASGPLSAQSAAVRQLEALERLAELARSFPQAADRLDRAAETLSSLGADWRAAHAEASAHIVDAQRTALEGVAGTLRAAQEAAAASLVAGHEAATRALTGAQAASASALVEAQERSSRALEGAQREVASGMRESLERTAKELQRAMAGAAERASEAFVAAAAPELSSALQASVGEAEKHLDSVRSLLAEEAGARVDGEARLRELFEAHVGQLVARFEQERESERASSAQLRALFEAHVGQLVARFEQERESERASSARLTKELEEALGQLAQRERERAEEAARADEARAASLEGLATRVGGELAAAGEALRTRVLARLDEEAAQAGLLAGIEGRLEQTAGAIAEAANRQANALETMVAAADARLRDGEGAQRERFDALLETVRSAQEAQAARMLAFEERVATLHSEGAVGLADKLRDHAEGLSAGLLETSDLLRDAASLVHAGGAEMTAVAEGFAASVEAQRDAARAWLDNLGHVEAAVTRTGEAAAADALGEHLVQTQELFERQLRFQNELYEQLRALRVGAAEEA